MQQHQIQPNERRAHARLAIDHEGGLTIKGSRARACRLRDFCPGGLHLDVPRPAWDGRPGRAPPLATRGDSAVVRFTAGADNGQQEFEIRVQVARVFEGGMGVAFVNPHPGALRALRQLAARGQEQGVARSPSTMESIRSAFRAAVAEHIEPGVTDLMRNIGTPLVRAASEAGSNQAQSRFFEAIPILDGSRGAIARDALGTVLERIAEFGDPDAKPRGNAAEGLDDGEISMELALVNVDEFEDFLVVAELVSAAESRFEAPLKELEHRLGNACGAPLSSDGNPVGAAALCHAFRDAIKGFQLHRDARLVVYRELNREVVPVLGAMFAEINEELERIGVLRPPKPGKKAPKPQNPPSDPVQEESTEVPTTPGADETMHEHGASPETVPVAPVNIGADGGQAMAGAGVATHTVDDDTVHIDASAGTSSPGVPGGGGGLALPGGGVGRGAAGAITAAVAWPGAGVAVGVPAGRAKGAGHGSAVVAGTQPRTALGTARALLGLQRRTTAPGPPASCEAVPTFSSDDVLDALGTLQHQGLDGTPGAALQGVLPALRNVLVSAHEDGEQRALATSEADPLDLMERLFHAMLGDRLLGVTTIERIARLQPAVHKANLLQAGFFDDVDHPARRLLDTLGRLDAAADDDDGMDKLVDTILERATSQFDRGLDPLGEAADSLEDLSSQCEAEYQRNVDEVIKAREAQEAFMRSRRKNERDTGKTEVGRDTQALEWSVWLNRARRLCAGDGLLVTDSGAPARRLTVAWVGIDHEMLLLVDARGHKADSPILQEMAMRLRRGTATMLPRHQHPLVARALRAALAAMHDGIEHVATHDRVTGLANRKQFEGELGSALTSAVQEHMEHVLLHIALDNHALALEQGGASAAESVARSAAKTLLQTQDKPGHVASLGDGSFGVLLENCSIDTGSKLAERLCNTLCAQAIEHDGVSYGTAARVGVARMDKRAPDIESVLQAARTAIGTDAEQAGERVVLGRRDGEGKRGGGPMMEWVPLLNRTLREDEARFRWQRITPLREDMEPTPFYEILLGVRDDHGKPVAPENLLQAAVYYQHMEELDRWVIRNALAWMAGNPARLADVGACAINLADITLADERLVEFVVDELLASGVPPGKVCFEISEAAVLANLAAVEDLMFTLREYGCRFTLVDVGGGGSAYEHLERLPVDFVKIGGIFVRDIATSADDLAVVQSIHEIGRFLGKQTIAECVEDDDTLRVLREVGVDYAQGFHIDRPRHVDDDTPFPVEPALLDTLATNA